MRTASTETKSDVAAADGRRRGGFTLLEIMIATGILTIGLASIVALFPVALNVGRQVIETSNAVVIAQSVAEAIRDGMRNRKRYSRDGNHVYFVFNHDGVEKSVPSDPKLEKPRDDYYILLPRYRAGRKFSGGSMRDRRFRAIERAKTFVYPETDRQRPNGNGNAFRADDDSDDDGDDHRFTLRVEKTYWLGKVLNPDGIPESSVLLDIKREVLEQYSFAFAITPSYFDADISQVREFEPGNQLYNVRVMVFRSFPKDPESLKKLDTLPQPVYELFFEVSL